MGRCIRVNNEALHVGNVSEQAENLEPVDELEGFCLAALHIECEDGTCTVREVLLVESVLRMICKARVVDLSDLRVLREEFENLLGVFDMAIEAERKRFSALQEEECIERRNCCTFVAEKNGADVNDVSCCASCCRERHAIARVRFGELRELARCSPIKLATVNNHAAESRTVTADELRCRMHDDISTVFERTNQVRSTEGVVDHDRNLVLVSEFGDGFDVRDVGVRVAERFNEDELGVGLDRAFDFLEVVDVDESRFNAELAERMFQEVVGATVNGALCDHVVTLASESRDGISKSCCTGSDCETCDTAFESGDALFKNVLRGIGEAAVNVACILQMETVRSVLSAVEHVRGGLVYRNCAGIGCRVSSLLTNVELKSFEMELILSRHII